VKVAVYTITKNEEAHIERWADSAHLADYRIVIDTGSTDDTIRKLSRRETWVSSIHISPWRFDDARNAALALVPSDVDYCIALDADEILIPGWRDALEELDPSVVTRPRYNYTWSWNADGTPGLVYGGDKIHARNGYRWRHPVHEVLTPTLPETQGWCGLEIHHHPDNSKSRGQYLPLLELAVREDPTDDRNAHYLGREYYYQGRLALAAHELQRHLALPKAVWAPERAKSMRLLAECIPEEAEQWLLRATKEDPGRREPWLALARYYYNKQDWPCCYEAAVRTLSITDRALDYISEADAWGPDPHDLAALAAFNTGRLKEALTHGVDALTINPTDERLRKNIEWYTDALV